MTTLPILMAEEFWANTQFSIVRYTGSIQIGSNRYTIVNKKGITIFELSEPGNKYYVGDGNKAIPPGEPCDLVREDWVPIYRALGRKKFIELLKKNLTLAEAKDYIKQMNKKKE